MSENYGKNLSFQLRHKFKNIFIFIKIVQQVAISLLRLL